MYNTWHLCTSKQLNNSCNVNSTVYLFSRNLDIVIVVNYGVQLIACIAVKLMSCVPMISKQVLVMSYHGEVCYFKHKLLLQQLCYSKYWIQFFVRSAKTKRSVYTNQGNNWIFWCEGKSEIEIKFFFFVTDWYLSLELSNIERYKHLS